MICFQLWSDSVKVRQVPRQNFVRFTVDLRARGAGRGPDTGGEKHCAFLHSSTEALSLTYTVRTPAGPLLCTESGAAQRGKGVGTQQHTQAAHRVMVL
jgi:hypothetical protein